VGRHDDLRLPELDDKVVPARFYRHSFDFSVEARSQLRKFALEKGAHLPLVRGNGFDVDKLSSQFEYFHDATLAASTCQEKYPVGARRARL
jgi:hypothetical protein